jgi:hypothetical protein
MLSIYPINCHEVMTDFLMDSDRYGRARRCLQEPEEECKRGHINCNGTFHSTQKYVDDEWEKKFIVRYSPAHSRSKLISYQKGIQQAPVVEIPLYKFDVRAVPRRATIMFSGTILSNRWKEK